MREDWPHSRLILASQRLSLDVVAGQAVMQLRDRGIEGILLKGPTISGWLYAGDERSYGDIDLLVEAVSLGPAGRVLAEMGFVASKGAEGGETLPSDRLPSAVAWERERDGIRIELHPTLVGVHTSAEKLWGLLRAHAVPFRIADATVLALDIPARLFSIALHVAQHGDRFPHPLEDLRRAIRSASIEQWTEAGSIAVQLDATDAFSVGLRTVPEGISLAELLGVETRDALHVAMHAGGARSSARELEWLFRTEGILWKVRLAVRKVVPPPAFMRSWSPLARRGLLGLAAAYLYRPIWLIKELVLGAVDVMRFRRRARNQR